MSTARELRNTLDAAGACEALLALKAAGFGLQKRDGPPGPPGPPSTRTRQHEDSLDRGSGLLAGRVASRWTSTTAGLRAQHGAGKASAAVSDGRAADLRGNAVLRRPSSPPARDLQLSEDGSLLSTRSASSIGTKRLSPDGPSCAEAATSSRPCAVRRPDTTTSGAGDAPTASRGSQDSRLPHAMSVDAPLASCSSAEAGVSVELGASRQRREHILETIIGLLPPGCKLSELMALADGIVGLLYAPPPPSTAVGAALWAGTQLHDLGSFSTAADAKQVLSRMPRLMATARPARPAPSTAGQAPPQPSAVPALPPRHSAPALAVPAASLATAGPAQPPQLVLAASVPVPASRPALSGPRGAPETAPARQALAPQSGPSQQQLAQPQLTEQQQQQLTQQQLTQQQLTQQVMQLLCQAAAAREAGRRDATAGLSRGPTGSTVSGRSVASSVLQELLLERSLARSVRSGGDAFAPLPQGKSVTSDEANNLFTQFTGHH